MTSRRQRVLSCFGILLAVVSYVAWFLFFGPILIVTQIHKDNFKAVVWICRSGVSPNRDAFMAGGIFHCSVASGHRDIAKLLINRGADVNRLDGYGLTPLMVAAEFGDVEMMRLLVSNGADISKRSRKGEQAVDIAIRYQRATVLKYLQQVGAEKLNLSKGNSPVD